MLGPCIVGQLFYVFGATPLVLGWLGIVMAVLAVAFHMIDPATMKPRRTEEFA